MGYTKHIYFDDGLYQLLKEETNVSALITRLLWDYYNSLVTKKVDVSEKEKEIINLEKEIEVRRVEVEEIKEKEIEKKLTEEEETAIKTKKDADTNKLRDAILSELSMEEQNKLINEESNA